MIHSSKLSKSKTFYVPALDGLRFLAFFLVFIHHTPLFNNFIYVYLNTYGWIGVDIFFALSAFLLSHLLRIEFIQYNHIDKKKFFLRRALRIWPIYFIYLFFSELPDKHLMLFTSNIYAVVKNVSVGHIWTISFEEQVYFFLPFVLVFLIKIRQKLRCSIAIFVFFSLIKYIFISNNVHYNAIYILPITHFESIYFGVLLGLGYFDNFLKTINSRYLIFIILTLFLSISNLDITKVNYKLHYINFIGGVCSMLMVHLATRDNNIVSNILSLKTLRYLGKISYGLYLYHVDVIFKINNIFAGTSLENPYLLFTMHLLTTIAIATLSWYLIEKPFLKLKNKFEIIRSRSIA